MCDHYLDTEKLNAAWDRTVSGGYNGGCMIVFKPRGVLIKTLPQDECIPPGATSYSKDQFATEPGSIEFVTVTFHMNGLIGAVQKHLDELGFDC